MHQSHCRSAPDPTPSRTMGFDCPQCRAVADCTDWGYYCPRCHWSHQYEAETPEEKARKWKGFGPVMDESCLERRPLSEG